MPTPVSDTVISDLHVRGNRSIGSADRDTVPPGGVYLAALLSRLATIWARRVWSASSQIASVGNRVTNAWWRPASRLCWLASIADRRTSFSSIRSFFSEILP
jgi:hypothetical protein